MCMIYDMLINNFTFIQTNILYCIDQLPLRVQVYYFILSIFTEYTSNVSC